LRFDESLVYFVHECVSWYDWIVKLTIDDGCMADNTMPVVAELVEE
jgi:hypothetical protein